MFEVVFYATPAGNEPVLEWLRGLEKDEKIVIGATFAPCRWAAKAVGRSLRFELA